MRRPVAISESGATCANDRTNIRLDVAARSAGVDPVELEPKIHSKMMGEESFFTLISLLSLHLPTARVEDLAGSSGQVRILASRHTEFPSVLFIGPSPMHVTVGSENIV